VGLSRLKTPLLIISLILLCDQALKFYVKLNFSFNYSEPIIENFFYLHFTENPGMAFGWKLPFFTTDESNKLFLSLFRVIAVTAIGWYLVGLIKTKAPKGLVISISLIFAGALGNIIDSAFYGMIFSQSFQHSGVTAELFPAGGGYAGFLMGKVVDMLYFPMFEGHWPTWMPFFGVDHNECASQACSGRFIFFRPIFNIADTSISVGVGMILVFSKKYFKQDVVSEEKGKQNPETELVETETDAVKTEDKPEQPAKQTI